MRGRGEMAKLHITRATHGCYILRSERDSGETGKILHIAEDHLEEAIAAWLEIYQESEQSVLREYLQ